MDFQAVSQDWRLLEKRSILMPLTPRAHLGSWLDLRRGPGGSGEVGSGVDPWSDLARRTSRVTGWRTPNWC